MGLNDEPTHLADYVPAGDFAKVLEAVKAGLIPQAKVDAAAAEIQKAIEEKKSAQEIVAIAVSVISGLAKGLL